MGTTPPDSTPSPTIRTLAASCPGLWGRHDPYFELAETLSWMQDLPRMEAHVLDAGHLLLETHSAAAVPLMLDFIRRTQREGEETAEHEPLLRDSRKPSKT